MVVSTSTRNIDKNNHLIFILEVKNDEKVDSLVTN
jgi:hypothetical protein